MSGLLLYGDTERSPAMRHQVPIAVIDPCLFAELDGRAIVLTSSLERERIAAVLPRYPYALSPSARDDIRGEASLES